MSINAMKLCSIILQEHFGENVRIVGEDLFKSKSKSVNGIMQTTKLSRRQVTSSLAILVQYRLAKFNSSDINESLAEYSLLYEKVLLFIRYPRYIYFIQKKFGNPSALLVEELLKSGMSIPQSIIIGAYKNSDNKNDANLKELRDSFIDLAIEKYIIRCPEASEDAVPQLKINMENINRVTEIDFKELKTLIDKGTDPIDEISEKSYWTINSDRFHQSFRDRILVDAIERQIDTSAAECFQFILQQVYVNTDPWAQTSNIISSASVRQLIEKKSANGELVKFFEQYISIIEKDACGFLTASSDSYGGYQVQFAEAFKQLTWSVIENVISQKFGLKAARIFRVVKTNKYIEQDNIQKEAMMPTREARLFTYNLMENNFIQIHSIKRSGGNGPAKPFFLFHVNQQRVARDLIETCYKALYNSKIRAIQDKEANKRLMEKSLRLQFFIESLKERGESEENIQEINETITPPEKEIVEKTKLRLKKLETSQIMIDEMLLILQLFINYQVPTTASGCRSSLFYAGKDLLDYTDNLNYDLVDDYNSKKTSKKSIIKTKE